MKLLLICAGGLSTSMLMKKLEKYAASKNMEFEVIAKGVNEVEDYYRDYDVLLMGPQVSYKKAEVEKIVANKNMPVAVIAQMDYALGNAENVFKLINSIYPR